MRTSASALCLISASISTAFCLQCTVCSLTLQDGKWDNNKAIFKRNSGWGIMEGIPFCLGINRSCSSPDEVCGYLHLVTTKYDNTQEVIIKRDCMKPEDCNLRDSLTTPVMKFSYATTCCDTDQCRPPSPILPKENNTMNGVRCPGCYTPERGDCASRHAMQCRGEETHCIDFHQHTHFGTVVFNARGCASKNVCKGNGLLSMLSKPESLEQIICSNSSITETLPVGNFLWCPFCHDYNVKNCTDVLLMCAPEENVCLLEKTRTMYDGREDVEITKRCGKSIECSRAGSIRSATKTIYMNTTCCAHNVCQPPLPALPPPSEDENGFTCPACFVPNSDRCLGRSNLKCTGNEERCIHYMKTEMQEISAVTESLHGCTTSEICDAGSGTIYARGHYHKTIKTEVMCSRAGGWKAPLCTILLSMIVTFIVLTLVTSW